MITQRAMPTFAPAILFGLLVGTGCGERQERVVIGQLEWSGANAIEHVLAVAIEEHLGVPVDFVPASATAYVAGMDRGNGSADVYADFWMPNQSAVYERYIAPGSRETIVLNDRPYTGTQGFYVPAYVTEELGIRRVDQLADPKVARLFDIDGDGKGDYWPGSIGFSATDVNLVKAKCYGFDKLFTPLTVKQTLMEKLLETACRRKEPFLFYFWTPERLFLKHDLRMLEEPPFDGYAMPGKKDDPHYDPNACWYMLTSKEDPAWLEKSRVCRAWPDATIHVAYSRSLKTRMPRVARFLQQVYFDTDTVSTWIYQIAEENRDPRDVARKWVTDNPTTVQEWLRGTVVDSEIGQQR